MNQRTNERQNPIYSRNREKQQPSFSGYSSDKTRCTESPHIQAQCCIPSKLQAVTNTLISRSIRLTNTQLRNREIDKITKELRSNKYGVNSIRKAIQLQQKPKSERKKNETEIQQTLLSYIKRTTDPIEII